jgi:hypothetical protein
MGRRRAEREAAAEDAERKDPPRNDAPDRRRSLLKRRMRTPPNLSPSSKPRLKSASPLLMIRLRLRATADKGTGWPPEPCGSSGRRRVASTGGSGLGLPGRVHPGREPPRDVAPLRLRRHETPEVEEWTSQVRSRRAGRLRKRHHKTKSRCFVGAPLPPSGGSLLESSGLIGRETDAAWPHAPLAFGSRPTPSTLLFMLSSN